MEETGGKGTEKHEEKKRVVVCLWFLRFAKTSCISGSAEAGIERWSKTRYRLLARLSELPGKSLLGGRIGTLCVVFMVCVLLASWVLLSI